MRKKSIGILILMLMTAPLVSATTTNLTEIQTKASQTVLFQPILLNWGVDQEQTENCGHGIILTIPWTYAQRFTPAKEKLTAVRLHIFKYGAPPGVQITVSIRENLTSSNLATKTIDASDITIESTGTWVLFDFEDITVTPGSTYFIVCSGSAGDETNAYCWFYNNEDTYSGGEAWIKPDEVSVWTNFTHGGFNPDDFCFKTYFRKPFGGSIWSWEQFIKRFPTVLPELKNL